MRLDGWKSLGIVLLIILLPSLGCNRDSDKKAIYELQEHCGKTAEQWVKAKQGEVLHYRAHYNARLNKCFILATLSQVGSNNLNISYDVIYDVNENKEYGHDASRFYSDGSESHTCMIRDKDYGGPTRALAEQAEQKWKEFVKEIMED